MELARENLSVFLLDEEPTTNFSFIPIPTTVPYFLCVQDRRPNSDALMNYIVYTLPKPPQVTVQHSL